MKKGNKELLITQNEKERINILNKNLEEYYKSIAHSGAPNEIDHKLRQLDIETKRTRSRFHSGWNI